MQPLYKIQVRKDAQTTNVVTVPEYEVPVLQTIFGAENVHNASGMPVSAVDEDGNSQGDDFGDAVGEFEPKGSEFDRLAAKYGIAAVEGTYGKKAARGLESRMSASAKKSDDAAPKKATGKKKPEADQSDDAAQ